MIIDDLPPNLQYFGTQATQLCGQWIGLRRLREDKYQRRAAPRWQVALHSLTERSIEFAELRL